MAIGIFDSATDRGKKWNDPNGPGDGEYAREVAHIGFPLDPSRYMWDGSGLVEWPGWAEEQAAKAIQEQKDVIAAERYEREIAGIDYNGMNIKTDRESQQILDSLAEKIRRGLVSQINWKCANGWMVLDASNIDEIEVLVLGHVQAAFAWEKQQVDAL